MTEMKNQSKTIRAVSNRIKKLQKNIIIDKTHIDYKKFEYEPTIDIEDFIYTIVRKTKSSKRIVLVALYYIEVILNKCKNEFKNN